MDIFTSKSTSWSTGKENAIAWIALYQLCQISQTFSPQAGLRTSASWSRPILWVWLHCRGEPSFANVTQYWKLTIDTINWQTLTCLGNFLQPRGLWQLCGLQQWQRRRNQGEESWFRKSWSTFLIVVHNLSSFAKNYYSKCFSASKWPKQWFAGSQGELCSQPSLQRWAQGLSLLNIHFSILITCTHVFPFSIHNSQGFSLTKKLIWNSQGLRLAWERARLCTQVVFTFWKLVKKMVIFWCERRPKILLAYSIWVDRNYLPSVMFNPRPNQHGYFVLNM